MHSCIAYQIQQFTQFVVTWAHQVRISRVREKIRWISNLLKTFEVRTLSVEFEWKRHHIPSCNQLSKHHLPWLSVTNSTILTNYAINIVYVTFGYSGRMCNAKAVKRSIYCMWLSVKGLASHSTHNRSFWGRFLQAGWPNQQCQST